MMKINFKTWKDEELKALDTIEPGSWIDLVRPTKEEIDRITGNFKIPADYIKSALDEDERPRCDKESGAVMVIFRVPLINLEEPITKMETTPLSIIIMRDIIITVSLKETEVLNDFYQNKVKTFCTTKKTRFLLQILSRINYHFLKNLDSIEKKTEEIELGLLKAVKNEEIIKLFGLQKTMIYFNAAVIGNGNVLDNIMKGRVVRLFEDDEELLENIIVENKQSIEMVSVYNNILSNTLDAYASIVSNNLNAVMKVLTSLTIILALPVMVASFYGMNVSIPLEDNPNAFLMTLLFSVLLSFSVAIIFIKKRWL